MTELTIKQLKDDLKSLQAMGDSQDGREAFWRLRENYARSAHLCLSLHAQLQQERVKSLMYQEALEAIVSGGDMAWQLDGENSYTLAMCRIANAALQALSAPQAQAGEGK